KTADAINALDFKAVGDLKEVKFRELEAMADGDGLKSLSTDKVEEFQARDGELTDITKRWSGLRELDEKFQKQREDYKKSHGTVDRRGVPFSEGGQPGAGGEPATEFKSLGQMFVESKQFKAVEDFKKWDAKADGNI